MQAFTQHCGIAVPMLRPNIDTDAIIPSREMKLVSKKGLGEGLFAGWRYTLPGGREPNADFLLNHAAYQGCTIILAGSNFGCGSSREHAAWALAEYGIRAIIAPSFGSIFFNNCIANGLLPIVLAEETISAIAQWVEQAPRRNQIEIKLSDNTLSWADQRLEFALAADAREMLLSGLDRIDITLTRTAAIDQFEHADRQRRPWAYLPQHQPQTTEIA
ncbi:3-isopropylmalate dehydratase small subunit [Zhongshania sp.]|jgi:3-isopropylmalate/(R)-2-methylmalate dehydratase small subunit|uniref:3-isopropylmalate dehydratase small subunit n=1 Tax=Zhongshania sp. TaxID=1971902 RepID=UPI002A818B9F|nr:3-isopropylmalate dehydratase small subunit [Zhongshania sp.]